MKQERKISQALANHYKQKASDPSLLFFACKRCFLLVCQLSFRAHLSVSKMEDKGMLAFALLPDFFCFWFKTRFFV
jgi:hypothetical protein